MKKTLKRILAITAAVMINLFYLPLAQAAPLTALSDNLSRLKNSTGTTVYANHTVTFTLAGTTTLNASETIIIDFDNDFGVTGFATSEVEDFDITVGGTEETIVANGGCASNDAIEITTIDGTEKTFTFTTCGSYTAGSAGAIIEVQIGTHATAGSTGNDQISNPTASQTAVINLTAAGDTGKVAVVIIDDDQIPVTASVNPTISFTVANTTLDLSILDSGTISTSSYNNITIGTNGSGGYSISVRDAGNNSNPGLYSAGASKLIASADASPLTAGAEGYGGQCNKVSGSGSCTFTGTGDNVDGFLLTDQTFASYGSKPSGTDTFQIRVKATISTSTDAGIYSDTLTLIGTANF